MPRYEPRNPIDLNRAANAERLKEAKGVLYGCALAGQSDAEIGAVERIPVPPSKSVIQRAEQRRTITNFLRSGQPKIYRFLLQPTGTQETGLQKNFIWTALFISQRF